MPPRKKDKDDQASLEALMAELKDKRIRNLYVFHGEEAYLREHYLGQLRELLLEPGMEAFNFKTLEGKEVDALEIIRAADCLPMMAQHTLVVVRDYDLFKAKEADREALMAYFKDLPEYLCLVFVYDVLIYNPDARTKLAASLKEHGLAVEFSRQEQKRLVNWIARRFKATGHDIDSEQAKYLIFLCGDLMQNLISEIGKIGSYAKARRITRADIDAVATRQVDAVVFQLTDALSARNYDRAMATLSDLLHMQETPYTILGHIGKHLRKFYSARVALESRRSADDLAALWKIHPYPCSKLMSAAQRVSLPWCREALRAAARADLALKSTGAAPKDVLTDLVLSLAHG